VTITREGSLVLIAHVYKDGHSNSQISLAKGGNLDSVVQAFTSVQGNRGVTTTWKWRNVNGVWVPEELTNHVFHDGPNAGSRHVRFQWTESIVNEPLTKDAFSLASLGVFRGDGIIDMRSKKARRIEEEEYPPRPPAKSAERPGRDGKDNTNK
jgi:hypothetical protein